MPKLEIGMQNERGFTLIEILVVLLIIGITSGVALLAFGDFGASRKIIMAAEQLSTYIKLVQQKAILETNTYGITVKKNAYETFRLEEGHWLPMSQNSLFKEHFFPDQAFVVFSERGAISAKEPNIIVYASGDMSAFELSFSTTSGTKLITISGHHNGDLILRNE